MQEFLSVFAVVAVVVASVGVGCIAIGLSWALLLPQKRNIAKVDKAVIAWLLYDAMTHLTLVSLLNYSPPHNHSKVLLTSCTNLGSKIKSLL